MTIQEKIIFYGKLFALYDIFQLEQLILERKKLFSLLPVEDVIKIYQIQPINELFAPIYIKHQLALPEK